MSRFPARRLEEKSAAYQEALKNRQLANGVSEDGSSVSPFLPTGDGRSYYTNPLLRAYNENPWRGDQTVKNFKGEDETVRSWQANNFFNANLSGGMFDAISEQLKGLQDEFLTRLKETEGNAWDRISSITGVDDQGDGKRYGDNGREGSQRYRRG